MRKLLATACLLVLAACGDSGPTEPVLANIAGTWRMSFVNMTGSSQGSTATCNGASFDFVITQTQATFSGVQQGVGAFSCSVDGTSLGSTSVSGETIVNGQVNGNSISFRFGSIDGQFSGTASGTSLSGTGQFIFSDGSSSFTLAGQFTAARL